MSAARSIVASDAISAGLFALVSLAALLFGLYVAIGASLDSSYLRTLRIVLALLSLAFAIAMAYQVLAIATRQIPTISRIADAAFRTHPIVWVTVFGVLMTVTGALALHFTRVAPISSAVVSTQRAFDATAHPVIWAVVLGLAIILASLLVSRLTPVIIRLGPGDPGFSWWVVLLGGGLYGVGALIAWATNWRP
jgi:hypothetical protein